MKALFRSTIHGSLGFAVVSLAAFSIWAFVPKLAGSELGMYALIALVFLVGAGVAMSGLLQGEHRLRRFYWFFLPAFLSYAVVWSLAWFLIKGRTSEWIGAGAGTLLFAWITWLSLERARGFWMAAVMLFALHSLGYFVGSEWMYGVLARGIQGWNKPQVALIAKLGWGLFYGLGFGAGIGFILGYWQREGLGRV